MIIGLFVCKRCDKQRLVTCESGLGPWLCCGEPMVKEEALPIWYRVTQEGYTEPLHGLSRSKQIK